MRLFRFIALLVIPYGLSATSYTWNNFMGGDWNQNGNWNVAGFPNGIGDSASIPAIFPGPASINVNQNITINSLTIANTSSRNLTLQTVTANTLILDVALGSTTITTSGSGSPTISVPIQLNTSTTISPGVSTAFSGIISSSGGITHNGLSTSTFSAVNSYTGATVLSAGTFALSGSGSIAASSSVSIGTSGTFSISGVTTSAQINTLSGSGGITIGTKQLSVVQNSDATFSGVIAAGSGSFHKAGSAALTLSGVNLYTGATVVEAGALVVTGSIAASSSTTVNSGATLKGTGSVSALTVQGKLQPGTSIGTITVASLTQAAGSTLSIEFDGTTNSKVIVTGAANIDSGATLELIPQSSTYVDGTIYTFLTAGSLTGTFDSVTLANGNLGDGVVTLLPASANSLSFLLSLLNQQQKAPVSITASLSTSMNRAQMGMITQIQDQRYLLQQVCCCGVSNGSEICERCGGGMKVCEKSGTYHPYIIYNNARADIAKRANTTYGFEEFWSGLAGIDFYANRWFAGGFAGGYTRGRGGSVDCNPVTVNCNTITANGYFQLNPFGKIYLDAGAVYGYTFYNSHRDYDGYMKADYRGYELASQARLQYQTCFRRLWARPYVGATYYLNEVDGYREKGSSIHTLIVTRDQFDFLDVEGGIYFWAPFRGNDWTFIPQVSFAYVSSYWNSPRSLNMGTVISGGPLFTTVLDNVSDDYWKVNGGCSFVFGDCNEFFFRFNTVIDEAYQIPVEYSLGFEISF